MRPLASEDANSSLVKIKMHIRQEKWQLRHEPEKAGEVATVIMRCCQASTAVTPPAPYTSTNHARASLLDVYFFDDAVENAIAHTFKGDAAHERVKETLHGHFNGRIARNAPAHQVEQFFRV